MLYKQIAQNKRNTWIVLVLYLILILAISFLFSYFLTIYAGIIFFIAGCCYLAYVYYNATEHLMKVVNAKEVTKKNNPEIYELVEELCLAGGLPVPKIYIVPVKEPNAFATGKDPEHASLALTQGLLDIMNKNEVQGVIGHELSHIRNYDTRITVIASAITNLVVITGLSLIIFGWTIITEKGGGLIHFVIEIFAAILLMIGLGISVIGIPLAKIFWLLVSRQREYLADAGSADLTREPSGIISALKKLKKLEDQKEIPTDLQDSTSKNLTLNSLYFNAAKAKNWFQQLFSDHPPLDKRIKRLENSDK